MSILLSEEEQKRFVAFLEYEISTGKRMIEQLEKFKMPKGLLEMEKDNLHAAVIIRNKLLTIEEDIIE